MPMCNTVLCIINRMRPKEERNRGSNFSNVFFPFIFPSQNNAEPQQASKVLGWIRSATLTRWQFSIYMHDSSPNWKDYKSLLLNWVLPITREFWILLPPLPLFFKYTLPFLVIITEKETNVAGCGYSKENGNCHFCKYEVSPTHIDSAQFRPYVFPKL